MRFLLPISVSLLLAWQAARAQTADDFFNGGAQLYISNNVPSALEKVENGLKIYPDDGKLKKLEELLKQQQQQQSQNNQSQQDQQNQQNQSQQQQSQPNSNSQKNQQSQNQPQRQSSQKNLQDQPKASEQRQNQSGEKKDASEKQSEQQKSSGEKKDADRQDQQNAGGQPVASGQMTPEEAKRLLDAQKGDEQILQLQPKGKTQDASHPVKDW
jgi:Ca-activated chloride channel homolog